MRAGWTSLGDVCPLIAKWVDPLPDLKVTICFSPETAEANMFPQLPEGRGGLAPTRYQTPIRYQTKHGRPALFERYASLRFASLPIGIALPILNRKEVMPTTEQGDGMTAEKPATDPLSYAHLVVVFADAQFTSKLFEGDDSDALKKYSDSETLPAMLRDNWVLSTVYASFGTQWLVQVGPPAETQSEKPPGPPFDRKPRLVGVSGATSRLLVGDELHYDVSLCLPQMQADGWVVTAVYPGSVSGLVRVEWHGGPPPR
jgi:hypothetical protein